MAFRYSILCHFMLVKLTHCLALETHSLHQCSLYHSSLLKLLYVCIVINSAIQALRCHALTVSVWLVPIATALPQYPIHAWCMQMSLLRIKNGRPMSVGDIVASVEEVDDQVKYCSCNL